MSPFLPIDSLMRCSLIVSIGRPILSACSNAIEVRADLQATATASDSGTNW